MAATTSSGTTHTRSAQRGHKTPATKEPSGPTLTVPYVTAELHTHEVHLPHLPGAGAVSAAAGTLRAQLPSRDQALFYGGLTAAAAFSVIEWPVAVAIGVGSALLRRSLREELSESGS